MPAPNPGRNNSRSRPAHKLHSARNQFIARPLMLDSDSECRISSAGMATRPRSGMVLVKWVDMACRRLPRTARERDVFRYTNRLAAVPPLSPNTHGGCLPYRRCYSADVPYLISSLSRFPTVNYKRLRRHFCVLWERICWELSLFS